MVAASVRVSAIMPAYNAAGTIEEAIRSVLAQEGVSFELLIGDDGSSDGTWEQIQPFRNDPRVRAWRFPQRKGPGWVRNRLARKARGIYLSICDADDQVLPGNFKRLSYLLDAKPSVGVAAGRVLSQRRSLLRKLEWDLMRMPIPHAGCMMKKKLFLRVGGYDTAFPVMEDYDLFLRLGEKTRLAAVAGTPVYRYRKHSRSRSGQPVSVKRRVVREIIARAIRRRYGLSAFKILSVSGRAHGQRNEWLSGYRLQR